MVPGFWDASDIDKITGEMKWNENENEMNSEKESRFKVCVQFNENTKR